MHYFGLSPRFRQQIIDEARADTLCWSNRYNTNDKDFIEATFLRYLSRGLNNLHRKINVTNSVALQTYQDITLQRIEDYYEEEFNKQLQRINYKDTPFYLTIH